MFYSRDVQNIHQRLATSHCIGWLTTSSHDGYDIIPNKRWSNQVFSYTAHMTENMFFSIFFLWFEWGPFTMVGGKVSDVFFFKYSYKVGPYDRYKRGEITCISRVK